MINEYDPDADFLQKLADVVQQKKDEDLIREIHEENDVKARQILPKHDVPRRVLYKSRKTEVI